MVKFARNVHFQIKSGKANEFRALFENRVLPLLRKQHGFREELTLIARDDRIAISLWDDRTSADSYAITVFPQVLETLKPVLKGTPRVSHYQIESTTLTV